MELWRAAMLFALCTGWWSWSVPKELPEPSGASCIFDECPMCLPSVTSALDSPRWDSIDRISNLLFTWENSLAPGHGDSEERGRSFLTRARKMINQLNHRGAPSRPFHRARHTLTKEGRKEGRKRERRKFWLKSEVRCLFLQFFVVV